MENNSTNVNCKLETKNHDKLGSSRLDYPLMWAWTTEHTYQSNPGNISIAGTSIKKKSFQLKLLLVSLNSNLFHLRIKMRWKLNHLKLRGLHKAVVFYRTSSWSIRNDVTKLNCVTRYSVLTGGGREELRYRDCYRSSFLNQQKRFSSVSETLHLLSKLPLSHRP